MEFELLRLASYVNWPKTSKVSPLLLARSGFYYSGTDEEVECFSCKTRLSARDNLQYRHRELAPQCEHLKNNSEKYISMKLLDSAAEDRSKITEDGVSRLGDTVTDDAGVVSDKTQLTNSYVTLSELYRHAFSRAAKKGVFQSEVNSEIDRSRPDTERLKREEERLLTFHDWPSGAHAQPIDLAREGFFYRGFHDIVQCAFCEGILRNWEPTDVPSVEHKKHFPNCNFVRGLAVENVPTVVEPITVNCGVYSINCDDYGQITARESVNSTSSTNYEEVEQMVRSVIKRQDSLESTEYLYLRRAKEPTEQQLPQTSGELPIFPQYSDTPSRFKSFRAVEVPDGQTAECLASVGWLCAEPGDMVQGFQYGGTLQEWEPEEDNSLEEDKICFGSRAVVKNHIPISCHYEVEARMDTPIVRAMMDLGYSRELIESAIVRKLSTTGDDFPNAASLLEQVFRMEDAKLDSGDQLQHPRGLHCRDASHLLPQQLSRLGFHYTGNGQEVRCSACGISHSVFHPEEDILRQHLNKSQYCPLLHGMKPVQVTDSDEQLESADGVLL